GQTAGNVPTRWEPDRGGGARRNATALRAGRTRIKARCFSRRVDEFINQNRRAKRDPRPELRIDQDAEYARAPQTRHLSQLDEIERCLTAHERKYDRISVTRLADHGLELLFDDRTRKIVEGMLAFPPPRVVLGVTAKSEPQRAAAVGDHNDRFRFHIQCRGAIRLRDD